jgi:hypothetical protein
MLASQEGLCSMQLGTAEISWLDLQSLMYIFVPMCFVDDAMCLQ